jgi:hypothetical protein
MRPSSSRGLARSDCPAFVHAILRGLALPAICAAIAIIITQFGSGAGARADLAAH